MILIFGGKYQGQLEYALEEYGLSMEDVGFCKEDIDYTKKVVADLQEFVWHCTLNGEEAAELIDWEKLEDKIVTLDDVSQGLVPMDKDERAFREMAGRTMLKASKRANRVIRVFCGLGQVLK